MTRAPRDPEAFLARLRGLDDILVAQGYPPISPWWWGTIERFYLSGRRRLVVRKGRRVGASTIVAPRLCVAEMLWGGHHHTPGAPPLVFAFLSVKREEAANRLRGIRAILDILGEPYREQGDSIELDRVPAVAKVATANFRLTVGDTVAWVWCDEVSRWRDDASGANPAAQVIGSLAPALATLPDATLWLVSSPLGSDDYHARAYDSGETEHQCTAFGDTWTANPTLTEADCRALEPDERTFLREYAARPQASISAAFPDSWSRAFREIDLASSAHPIGIVDASSGGGDSFAWGLAFYATPQIRDVPEFLLERVPKTIVTGGSGRPVYMDSPDEFTWRQVTDHRGLPVANPAYAAATRPVAVFQRIDSFDGRFKGTISGSQIVERIAQHFRRAGVSTVVGDQREAFFLHSEFMRHGLAFREISWTTTNKIEAVTRLKRMFAEESIVLPEDAKLRRELASYTERITASGSLAYSARGTGHDDRVSLLLTFAMAELERLVPGSPVFDAGVGRHVVAGR